MPTGTKVFDWTIPHEWNIRDTYIKHSRGERIVDFTRSNLPVPVRKHVSFAELSRHVHTLPGQPDLIPYRTSYYAENWGFCMPHRQFEQLREEMYEVLIDSSLEDGYLTYGEYLHKGETADEFLLLAHVCHPSPANDNCSGVALLTHLAKRIASLRTGTATVSYLLRAPSVQSLGSAQREQYPKYQARACNLDGWRWRRSKLTKRAEVVMRRSGHRPYSAVTPG